MYLFLTDLKVKLDFIYPRVLILHVINIKNLAYYLPHALKCMCTEQKGWVDNDVEDSKKIAMWDSRERKTGDLIAGEEIERVLISAMRGEKEAKNLFIVMVGRWK